MEASSVLYLLMRIFHQVWEADEWYSLVSRSGLKAEFQIPETTYDLLYTLMSHQPTFPLHNKRVWRGCICVQLMLSANAFLNKQGAIKRLSWRWHVQLACLYKCSVLWQLYPNIGAKEVVKGALRLRRPVVRRSSRCQEKEEKEERNNSINEFLMAVLCVQELM